jgi:hypothetical protein
MIVDWLRRVSGRSQSAKPTETKMDSPHKADWLLAAERDSIVASHLSERLARLGVVQVSPRLWVDGSNPPAKRVFEIALLKGASMKANWGFSLDFVPHISGGKARWHRKDRTAKLDVIVDPRGYESACSLYGADRLHRDLERLVPVALERAQETWRRGSTWSGLLDIVREIREQQSNCFGFYNYTQLPLAFIFLSAKIGDFATAQAELKAFARRWELDDDVAAKLAKLVGDVALD